MGGPRLEDPPRHYDRSHCSGKVDCVGWFRQPSRSNSATALLLILGPMVAVIARYLWRHPSDVIPFGVIFGLCIGVAAAAYFAIGSARKRGKEPEQRGFEVIAKSDPKKSN